VSANQLYLPPDYYRQGTNRGFKNPRRAGVINPRILRLQTTEGRRDPTAPKLPKVRELGVSQPYGDMPDWWQYSLGEWIVYWYLVYVKHFVPEKDFYHQSIAFVPFLYQDIDVTQADFLLDYGPDTPLGVSNRYKALIFDPFDPFTHDMDTDIKRRMLAGEAGYLIVFMLQAMLESIPETVIEAGLKGKDLSDRGDGGEG
jgi:hypothetical protein